MDGVQASSLPPHLPAEGCWPCDKTAEMDLCPTLSLHSSPLSTFRMNYGALGADTYSFLLSPFLQGHKPPEEDGMERSCYWHPNLPQLNQQDLWLPFNLHLATNRSAQLPTGYSYFNRQFLSDPWHSYENNLGYFVLPRSTEEWRKFQAACLNQILDAVLLKNTKQLLTSRWSS